jgi:DNA-binding LacI/PurR family transcriptional regulator/DNA-binding transcriptional regulator YhcF (GntR family)
MNKAEYKKDIIYQKLKDEILSGKFTPGMKLPKELDFARELGVGKITLRSALDRLEKEGLIARMPSKGTFVLEKAETREKLLIISDECEAFESPNKYILPEVSRKASEMDMGPEICGRSFIESLTQEELNGILKKKNIKGIIFLASNFTGAESIINQLNKTNLPVLLPHGIESDTRTTGFASIVIRLKDAWKDAIKHLCKQGHTRIAAITKNINNFRGYTKQEHLELLNKNGAEADESLAVSVPYEKEAIHKTVEKWLSLDNPPSAILCFSDFFAIHVYETLKQNNIKIPEDIAVMGCCGYPGGAFMSPPLSTVDFEYARIGSMSVELMNKSQEWSSNTERIAPPQIIKPHRLEIRGSAEIKRVDKQIMEELINA